MVACGNITKTKHFSLKQIFGVSIVAKFGLINYTSVSARLAYGYINGRSQIMVNTDEWTQVHSTRSSLTITHPRTNQDRCCLTSVNVSLSYIV